LRDATLTDISLESRAKDNPDRFHAVPSPFGAESRQPDGNQISKGRRVSRGRGKPVLAVAVAGLVGRIVAVGVRHGTEQAGHARHHGHGLGVGSW
jgi:hypothetical protein